MNKKQLIAHGKKFGIILDEGMVKKTMVQLIRDKALAPEKPKQKVKEKPKQKSMAKPNAKKSKEKAKLKPVKIDGGTFKIVGKPITQPKGFWQSIKEFFGV
jgi:hypothetical protein